MFRHYVPIHETKGYIYPYPFPGYAGPLTYACDEAKSNQAGLGKGIVVWMLEIIIGTVQIEEFPPGHKDAATKYQFSCKMKKQLVSLPDDARNCLKAQRERFIIETWRGEASKYDKAIAVECDGISFPPEGNWDFHASDMPLSRKQLAGRYEFVMDEDDKAMKAFHTSWLEEAALEVDSARGYMMRLGNGFDVCKSLAESNEETSLLESIRRAHDFLNDAETQPPGEHKRQVFYTWHVNKVSSLSTVEETFKADIEVHLRYKALRSDVFTYFADWQKNSKPGTWTPMWQPPDFKVMNSADEDSVQVQHRPYRLRVLTPEGKPLAQAENAQTKHAYVKTSIRYIGRFHQSLRLHHFPFDTQWFKCCFKVEPHNDDAEFCLDSSHISDPDGCCELEKQKTTLRDDWVNVNEDWELLYVGMQVGPKKRVTRSTHATEASVAMHELEEEATKKRVTRSTGSTEASVATHEPEEDTGDDEGEASKITATQVKIVISAKRLHLGLLVRMFGILFLLQALSLMAFFLHPIDDLADRINLIFMMMLTAAAYNDVVANSLPRLGYLTHLEIYILIAYVYFTIVAFTVASIGLVGRDLLSEHGPNTTIGQLLQTWGLVGDATDVPYFTHSIHTFDSLAMFANFCLLIAYHVAFGLYWWLRVSLAADNLRMDQVFAGWITQKSDKIARRVSRDYFGADTDSDGCDDPSRPLMSRHDTDCEFCGQ